MGNPGRFKAVQRCGECIFPTFIPNRYQSAAQESPDYFLASAAHLLVLCSLTRECLSYLLARCTLPLLATHLASSPIVKLLIKPRLYNGKALTAAATSSHFTSATLTNASNNLSRRSGVQGSGLLGEPVGLVLALAFFGVVVGAVGLTSISESESEAWRFVDMAVRIWKVGVCRTRSYRMSRCKRRWVGIWL